MTEDHDLKDSQVENGNKFYNNKNKDKKTRIHRPLTKIILRRLPPTMTEDAFLEQVSPIPEHDYFYFSKPDLSLGNNVYSRAYINFMNIDDIYLFRDKFDGYVFLDEKGIEYIGIVEYAPFQRIAKKKKKKDPKCGTIESDPIYQDFLESLSKDQEVESQPKLEYSYPVNDVNDKKVQSTPLLDYLNARKLDKRGRDERRRRENDKRKMRIERKTKEGPIKEEDFGDNEVKKVKSREWEKDRSFGRPKDDQIKSDNKESVFEPKSFREQRKPGVSIVVDKKKKMDAKDEEELDDSDKNIRKDKRDKQKDSPREQKIKKYSDTRKERIKQNEIKSEKQSFFNKVISSDSKQKSNYDDIKPFTQLPQVKTDDLIAIDTIDKKSKVDDYLDFKIPKESKDGGVDKPEKYQRFVSGTTGNSKIRRNSLDSGEISPKEEVALVRQKSMEDRSKSSDREGSEEKEKNDNFERRTEKRIRNKDRPSLVIYQPGMGKFSKQRLAKEKEIQPPLGKSLNSTDKKDT